MGTARETAFCRYYRVSPVPQESATRYNEPSFLLSKLAVVLLVGGGSKVQEIAFLL